MTSDTTTDHAGSTANLGRPAPDHPTKIVAGAAVSTAGATNYPLRTVIAASGIQELRIRVLTSSQESISATTDTRSM